ncbi:hypothetical protein ACOME3_005358 [Neoechinorhynchus agilis]
MGNFASHFQRQNKKNADSFESASRGAFELTAEDLTALMNERGSEATIQLETTCGGIEGLAKILKTDKDKGLSVASDPDNIELRASCFGRNSLPQRKPKHFLTFCWDALQDALLVILLLCAVLSFGLSFYHPPQVESIRPLYPADEETNLEWIEGVAIFVAVLIVVLVTGVNDWQKDRQFRDLQKKLEGEKKVSVVRDGQMQELLKDDILVGDVYAIKYGDLIQADGFLIQGNDLTIDESSVTGESDHVKKNAKNRALLSGTTVMEGSGTMIVTAVGLRSQTGKVFALLSESKVQEKSKSDENKGDEKKKTKKMKSVLQGKLARLARVIAIVGLCAAILTFIALIIRFCVLTYVIQKQPWNNNHIRYIIDSFVQGITVIVVAVPEGLPLAVALALAFAVKRMLSDNNLVRHLNACETMGNATTICSDKTGTLTTNRMTVTQCYLAGKHYKVIDNAANEVSEDLVDILCESISTNSNYSSIQQIERPGDLPQQLGNKTECALLGLVTTLGRNYETYREKYPDKDAFKVFTFNSKRKTMTTVLRKPNQGYCVYTKGASEVVLERCRDVSANGTSGPQVLNENRRNVLIKSVIESMACAGLRTICVAYKLVPSDEGDSPSYNWEDELVVGKDLTLLCIAGIQDPVRPEVPPAIRQCQRAGVTVRMVTGDNINTARSIATQCGILNPKEDFLALESKSFNEIINDEYGGFSQTKFDSVWPRLRVLARSSPNDKFVLVNGIISSKISANREVVAVTGDGTNDAPALKSADVGFAMGIQGTDIAKQACDIILLDDNFTSIVKALMWGRNVYDNVAKFLQFQLTANVAAGFLSVISAAAISRVPLTAVQMLWVNLVMDTLASVALASERPTIELLDRKPYGRTKFIISTTMFRNIIGHALYQLIVLFILMFEGHKLIDVDSTIDRLTNDPSFKQPTAHFTLVFNAFVLMTLFNEINARKLHCENNVFKGIFNNFIFVGVWLGCFSLQVLIVFVGGIPLSAVRLDAVGWGYSLMFGVGSLLFHQLLNLVPPSMFSGPAKLLSQIIKRKRRRTTTTSHTGIIDLPLDNLDESEDEDDDYEDPLAGQWMRGIRRLRTYVDTIDVFKDSTIY